MRTLALALLVAACGTDSTPPPDARDPDILPGLNVLPAPANGIQIITPIVRDIAPGADLEMCTWTTTVTDHIVDVRSTQSIQTATGHHMLVYYTTQKQPPGTSRLCTDADMATFRFVSGSGGDGIANEAPGDLVFRIPAGAQIVANHHYLNATDQTTDAQSLININFADPGGTYTPSASSAFLDTSMMIPPGDSAVDIHCTVQQPMKTWFLIPHMHQWGTHINVDVTQGGTTQRMFDTVWSPSFTFHPPELRLDLASPMRLAVGDQVSVHCDYHNDTGATMYFGQEMCVSYGQFVDDTGVGGLECDGGSWGPF